MSVYHPPINEFMTHHLSHLFLVPKLSSLTITNQLIHSSLPINSPNYITSCVYLSLESPFSMVAMSAITSPTDELPLYYLFNNLHLLRCFIFDKPDETAVYYGSLLTEMKSQWSKSTFLGVTTFREDCGSIELQNFLHHCLEPWLVPIFFCLQLRNNDIIIRYCSKRKGKERNQWLDHLQNTQV